MKPDYPAWRIDLADKWAQRAPAAVAIAITWGLNAAVRFVVQTIADAPKPHGGGPVQADLCPSGGVEESIRRHVIATAICTALQAAGYRLTAGATPTAATTALWDPSTGIPADALRASNVDASSSESGIAGIEQIGWKICGWRGPEYSITVYSTARTVDQFENKPGNVDFTDVTIAGRSGRQFRLDGASKHLNCNVVFAAQQGVVQLQVLIRAALDNPPEPCELLARIGENLVPWFPE
ncbi:DUF3558 domain-containing protein [Nocardia sp. AB354]|uniref:DUF3558 domain-containing protein n=1 Tax=Nocardia sp. AB354 TaxID=3413283 RepID=UPI003C188687